MPQPLTSAYLKVERARKHLTELDLEVRRFVKNDPYRLALEPDPETGQAVVRFRTVAGRPIRAPLSFGLIAGDVIHSLRSALDHVVYALAIAGGRDGERSQFPLVEDVRKFPSQDNAFLGGVVDSQRAIIRSLQPFHVREALQAGRPPESAVDPLATNVYLMSLGRLDNIDKHRILLPSEFLVPFREPSFTGVAKAEGTYPADWFRVRDGAEYFRVTSLELLPGLSMGDVQVHADHPFTIGFGDPEWGAHGAPNDIWGDRTKAFVTKADLAVLVSTVESVIGLFDPYFRALG